MILLDLLSSNDFMRTSPKRPISHLFFPAGEKDGLEETQTACACYDAIDERKDSMFMRERGVFVGSESLLFVSLWP